MNDSSLADLRVSIVKRYAGDGRYYRTTYSDTGLEAIAENRARFPLSKTALLRKYSPHGLQRYMLVKDQFEKYLTGRILDVGSRENVIFEALKIKAELVDKNAKAVAPTDLEKDPLPYDDNTFDTVVCLDTLEHIDHLHETFDELVRVTKRYVIFSLPNNWRKMFRRMLKGWSIQGAYGLPPEKPMDRHKWTFNAEEVEDFIFYTSVGKHPYTVLEVRDHFDLEKPWHYAMYSTLKALFPRHAKNLFVNTTFYVLEKKQA